MDDLNPEAQEQQPEYSAQEEDARAREESEPNNNQKITSPSKGEDAQEIITHQEEALKEPQIPDVQNKLEATTEQDTTAMQAQMEQVLQNPQQCVELMQLCIARTKVLTLFPTELRLRIVPAPPMEEEVETHSDHSTASGIPL